MMKNKWVDISIIGTLAFLLLLPSVRFGFVNLDDNFYVTGNIFIRHVSLSNIKYFFTSFHHGVYAPIQYLTYMLAYSASGYHAMLYHLISIVFSLAAGTMVYLVVDQIQGSRPVAFFSALLFLFSPVNIDSAVWIAELKNPQSLFFFLAGFYFYILFRERRIERQPENMTADPAGKRRDRRKIPGHKAHPSEYSRVYALSVAAFVFGLLVKPPGATVIIMMFFYDWISGQAVRDSIKRLLPFAVITLPFMIVYLIGQSTIGAYHGLIRGSIWSQIKTITSVASGIFNYPLKILLPFNLSIVYPIDARISGAVFVMGTAVLFSVIMGIRALLKKDDKKQAFWLLWYFVNMLPYYGIIAMPFFANWYLYIPSIGIYTLLAGSIVNTGNRKLAYGILTLLVIIFGVLGFERQFVWKNDISLWRSSLNSVGEDPYVLRNLAVSYFRNNENAEGIVYGTKLLEQTPGFVTMRYLIGKGYAGLHEYGKAQDTLNSALNQLNDMVEKGIAGAAVMPGLGDTPDTLRAMIFCEMADIKQSLDQPAAALLFYNKAITAAPYVPAYDQLAYLYVKLNRIDDAKSTLEKISALKPDDPEPWRMLGYITARYYNNRGLAAAYFKKSLAVAPDQPFAHDMRDLIKSWETNTP